MKDKFLLFQEHQRYLIFGSIVGMGMLLLVPPFQTPDDAAHYFRAVDISEGALRCTDGMVEIQNDRLLLPNYMKLDEIAFKPTESFDYTLLFESYPQDDQQIRISNPSTCGTSVINYLAPAATIFSSSIFNNELLSYYLGRLSNLVLALVMTSLAIKFVPFGKKLFVLAGLLPVTVSLYASYNYDWLIISSTMLFISYVIKVYYIENITRKDLLIIAVLSLSLTTKYAIQPLFLILFPLVTLMKGWKKKLLFITYLFSLVGVIVALLIFTMYSAETYVVLDGIKPIEQLKLVLFNPLFFIKVLITTFYYNLFGFFIQSVGTLGWLDYNIGKTALISILFAYMLAILEPINIKYAKKITFLYTILIAAILTIIMICLALYMFWNEVGATSIVGLQGRYFTVSLLLLFLFIYVSRLFQYIRGKVFIEQPFSTLMFYIFISIAYLFTFYSMLLRYLF